MDNEALINENKIGNPEKKVIPVRDRALAIGVYALSFILIRYAAGYWGGLWGGIVWLLFGALGAAFVKLKKYEVTKAQITVFAISEVFCFTPLFSANGFVNTLAAIFSFALDFYLLVTIAGGELFGKHFIRDALSAVFFRPFLNFAKQPVYVFSSFRGRGRNFLYAALGILLAIPLTAVAVTLMMSSDSLFESEMKTFFSAFPSITFSIVWQLLLAVPIAMYLFGALCSSGNRIQTLNSDLPAYRIIPPLVSYFAVTPVCVFYLVYVITQLRNIAGAVNQTLDYSEFARKGFFELCAISVINLFVIVLIQTFTQRKENDRKSPALKGYTVALCIFTLMIIATALTKMFMYINEYGMTVLRVYTSWFMILEALIFIIITALQLKDFNVWKPLFCVFTAMFALLCFGNAERKIASYNISAYERGAVKELDIYELYELGVSAVKPAADFIENSPAYKTLPKYEQEGLSDMMSAEMKDLAEQPALTRFSYFSIPRFEAERATVWEG